MLEKKSLWDENGERINEHHSIIEPGLVSNWERTRLISVSNYTERE